MFWNVYLDRLTSGHRPISLFRGLHSRMNSNSGLAIARAPRPEDASGDWVVTLSRQEPGRPPANSLRWAERGPLHGFFEGQLFNREEFAASFNRVEQDCSDADLVLRAYEREGEAALSRLRGIFVVAIVDSSRGVAIVARDPLGMHPLFYVEAGSRVMFAASPLTLLRQSGVSRIVNRAALADHLCQRWPDPGETFFVGIRRVPATWKVVLSVGGLRLERYWDPIPEDQPIRWLSAEETARFDEIFERAVDRCLHHGRNGIFLSGGLDSISVAAVATDRARRLGQPPPWAFSLDFPDPECSEGARQAAVARALRLPQHLIDFHEALRGRGLLEQVIALCGRSAAPVLGVYTPAYAYLTKRAKLEGVRTILTGQGGDESLSLSPVLAADLIRRGAFVEATKFFGILLRSYPMPPLQQARNVFWRFGLRPLLGLTLHRLMPKAFKANRVWRTLSGDPVWAAPDGELRAEQQRRVENALPVSDPPNGFYMRQARTAFDHALVSGQEEERFEMGKQFGVRFVHPFCDPDVVDLCYRSLPTYMSEGGRTKGLVRRTIARRFPGLGLEEQRKVLAKSYYHSVLRREWAPLVDLAGDFPALSALGVVDGRAAGAVVRGEGQASGMSRLFHLIGAEMWTRAQALT
jgi:asparagine synthetase B (glutamine-hydrolysing)